MSGYVVVDPDDDTLREKLANAVWLAPVTTEPYVIVDTFLAVLRDVGTPATEERRPTYRDCQWQGTTETRLVTDWTEAPK